MPLGLWTPEDSRYVLSDFFNRWQPKSYANSVAIALQPGKRYFLPEPVVITLGAVTSARNFRFTLYGNGSQIIYTGGPNLGPAIQIGNASKEALYCAVRDVEISAEANGADSLLRLGHGSYCTLSNVNIRGPGAGTVRTGIEIENQKSLRFEQVSVGYCDVGVKSGVLNNVFSWTAGKVHNCGIGIWHDGSVFDIGCVDCSNCSEHAVRLDKASKGRLHLYTEDCGPRGEGNDGAILDIRQSHHVTISGILNCKGGTFYDPQTGEGARDHCAWGAIITDSRDIGFENCECLMPMVGLWNATNSTVFKDSLTSIRRSRLDLTVSP